MDLKSDDIFNVDIDASIWLSYELDKLNLDIQLDIESALLSVEDNKMNETTNSFKDTKNQDLKMSLTNVQTVVEEPTEKTELEKRDINGNKESSSDENFIQLFDELELSDSDNEAVGEEGSELIERGPEARRLTKRRNRTNYLQRNNERYERSQFPARSLEFLAGSTLVQSCDTPVTVIQPPIFNINENILTSSSNDSSLSIPSPVVYEDPGASAFGSPESGYESSITGSPPHVSSLPVSNLDSIPETDDIIDLLFDESTPDPYPSALSDNNICKCDTDDKDHKEKINQLINYLKDTPGVLNKPVDARNSQDDVPLVYPHDNPRSGNSSPRLRHVEIRKRIEYKLENKAKTALKQFLSDTEYHSTQARLHWQINDDIVNKREVKIIQVVDEVDGTSENRTNLHHAVINSNIEEIYCLVEVQKQYKKPLSDINIRDKYGKTALDYAVQNNMTFVVDYLKENTACQSVNI